MASLFIQYLAEEKENIDPLERSQKAALLSQKNRKLTVSADPYAEMIVKNRIGKREPFKVIAAKMVR